MSARYPVPSTPRVISPSPTLSDFSEVSRDTYFPPTTRSAAKQRHKSPEAISEEEHGPDPGSDVLLDQRARARSRSPILASVGPTYNARRRLSGLSSARPGKTSATDAEPLTKDNSSQPSQVNGHLSPYSYSTMQNRWREFSRSPSPLGLIPLHRHYRYLIHKHEIPRKALHVGVGFLTIAFYTCGLQTTSITPWLLSAFVPIAATDYLRHRFQSFNRFYVRCLGALMRETEVDGWNGVIWYLLGAYLALRFFPKDVGVMSVLLLSWCDTAASTFGRLYGRYTIRLRREKSLAGTVAAFITGVSTAILFWGWLAPRTGPFPDDPVDAFTFTGTLGLPRNIIRQIGWKDGSGTVTGAAALGVMSTWTGIVAAFSEFVDIFGWDDNLTIPVLSGFGLWGFLKIFRA